MEHDDAGLESLPRSECLALLASVPVGRIVYTDVGLPAVTPVNFLVDREEIVIRTGAGTRLAAAANRAIVAFEVDRIDVDLRNGWSVVVVGHARGIHEPDEILDAQRLPLQA